MFISVRTGVLANVEQGTIGIEMSTILPATSRELASKASQAGVEALDVAISGSTPAAEQGTLTLLAGGNPDAFQASQPIFQAIAAKYFHLGPTGAGTTMKILELAGEVDAAMPATSAAFQVNTEVLQQVRWPGFFSGDGAHGAGLGEGGFEHIHDWIMQRAEDRSVGMPTPVANYRHLAADGAPMYKDLLTE